MSTNRVRRTAVKEYEIQIATIFNTDTVYFSDLFLSEEQIDQYEDVLEQVLHLSQMYNLKYINTGEVRFESLANDDGSTLYGIVEAEESANQNIDVINFGDKPQKAFSCGAFSKRVRTSAANKLIVTHEFAHVLTDPDRNASEATSLAYWRELDDIWKSYKEQESHLRQENLHISEYSFSDINEFHAEAFVECHLSDTPTLVSVQVGRLIGKYYRNRTN